MLHYVCLRWARQDEAAARLAEVVSRQLTEQTCAWKTAIAAAGLLVLFRQDWTSAATSHVLPNHQGVVFGTLFKSKNATSGDATKMLAFTTSDMDRIAETSGQTLVDNFWGSYVAILFDRQNDELRVLRDPTEGLPCYYICQNGLALFFSHVEDLVPSGVLPRRINWNFIYAHLVYTRLQVRNTGLESVYELQGGECLTLSSNAEERTFYWTPHRFCHSNKYDKLDLAANALRTIVHSCTGAWASAYDVIMEELSGGLDSAILLSGLRRFHGASQVICVNHLSPGLEGDERAYARKAAGFWGCELVEQELDPTNIHLEESIHIPTILRPCYHVLTYGMDDALARLAQERGAHVIMSGRAGDQLFYKSNTPLTVADYFWKRLGLRNSIKIAKNRAIVIGSTIPAILSDAIRYGVRRQLYEPHARILRYAPFLNQDALGSVEADALRHPWLADETPMPPGKRDHVFAVIDSQNFNYEPLGRSRVVDVVNPLISQPIIEQCLETPSYVLASGRRDRGLARRAFADDLPPEILNRRTKGGTGRYFSAVLENNLEFLREFLLDGHLAREKLIVRELLEPILAGYEPIPIDYMFPFMSCVSVEAWLRSWARVGA